jgi:acyl-CoA reductase-like NAD-dependent aldehyde dehydrogenase
MNQPQFQIFTDFVGGKRVAAEHAAGVLNLIAPQSGQSIGQISESGKAGVDRAVAAALIAFTANRKQPTHQRITWLNAAAASLRAAGDEIASLICEDVGKPIRMARFEIKRGAEFLELTAAALTQIGGEILPLDITAPGANHIGFVRGVPYGVVAGITPFNAPVNLLVQKIAPAIAAGNAIVIKPALAGTRAALRLAQLFHDTGWPKDMFTVVTGDRDTALALASHRDVRAVSFTGGTVAGDALARAAGAKKFVAELGSNAANIVMADADIETAAKKIASAAFEASGQQCISAQRVLVARPALDMFLQHFTAAARALNVDRADDPKTDIGPMVSKASATRVMAMCEDAVAKGARFALQPRQDEATVTPGILTDVPTAARLWREEVFGPIALVAAFDDVDDALRMANDSEFGLQGAVFTKDLATALRFSDDFDVGALWINEATRFRLDNYPFGGMKRSGVGREGVRYAIEEFSQIKFTGITI